MVQIAQALGQLQAAAPGHAHVHDGHVRAQAAGEQCLGIVHGLCGGDLIARVAQAACEGGQDEAVIVHQQKVSRAGEGGFRHGGKRRWIQGG